jgi:hypothetical protein
MKIKVKEQLACEECGLVIQKKFEEMSICKKWFEETYAICCNCGNIETQDESYWINENWYCCDCCCECCNCGNDYPTDEMVEDEGDYVCEDCWEERQEEKREKIIKTYSFKPKPIFHSCKKDSKLFMGIELEVEMDEDIDGLDAECTAGDFSTYLEKLKLDKQFYIKDDGSLNNGFEIVTHPFTLKYAKKLKFSQLLKWLKDEGCLSYGTGNCGLHIHTSRNYYTKEELIRLRSFFAICVNELKKFSFRKGDYSFCEFEEYNFNRFLREEQDGRYHALNLNTEQPTIEFRLFRGTLKYERFMACLEFCQSISDFIKKVTIINNKSVWKEYVNYLYNKDTYKYLKMYIK